jgi:hypothetical protein
MAQGVCGIECCLRAASGVRSVLVLQYPVLRYCFTAVKKRHTVRCAVLLFS